MRIAGQLLASRHQFLILSMPFEQSTKMYFRYATVADGVERATLPKGLSVLQVLARCCMIY